MKIIQEREYKEAVSYHKPFYFEGHIGNWGYVFECGEAGQVDTGKLNPDALNNYNLCLTGEVRGERVIECAVEKRVNRWWTSRIGRCGCGEEVYLDNFTNTCDRCGADYNMDGQRLADRSQWGEETGEHWSECY